MRKKNNKTAVTVVLMLMVVFGMLGLGSVFNPPRSPAQEPATNQPAGFAERDATRKLALSCTLDSLTKFHIHPHLQIVVNGKNEIIPANVGITVDCMRPIHTHDTSGEIHVESPEEIDFTLGDFFAVWQEPFSSGQILDYRVNSGHEILMTVDGRPSGEFENLVLRDQQQIVIEYRIK